MLNPASATDLDDELLRLVTYLTPNEQEASVETGLPLAMEDGNPSRKDLEQIAAVLRSKGVEHIIITLGGSGSAVVSEHGIQYIPCVKMGHVADPTAAGGLLRGCFLCGIDSGADSGGGTGFCQPYRRYYRLTDGSNAIRAPRWRKSLPSCGSETIEDLTLRYWIC